MPSLYALIMPIFAAFKRSIDLLGKKYHRKLYAAMAAQIFIAFFDTLGVLLIGVITLSATATAQGNELPSTLQSVVKFVGLGGLETNQLLGILGAFAVILFVARSIVAPLLLKRILKFLTGRSAEISGETTERFFSQSLKEVHWESSQTIAFALGIGITAMISDTLGASVIIVAETALLTLMSILLLLIDPTVTIFTLAYFIIIMLFIQSILGKWAARSSKQKFAADIAGQSAIQELVSSYREIFVGHHVEFYIDKFSGVRKSGAKAQANLQLINYIPKYALEAALVIGASLLTLFEFISKSPSAAVSTLVLFLSAASRMFPSLLRIQGSVTLIRAATSASKYTSQILALLEGKTSRPTLHEREKKALAELAKNEFVPGLELKNVEFSYHGEGQNVINEVSTEILPGSFVALVGPTGSGKSTLVDLMLGVSKPTSGSLSISGVPPRDAVKIWPGKIGFVPQVVSMSATSVRENIALGMPKAEIDDDAIWDVLERVRLADLLRDAREGLDTEVGERGIRFSGGQRQRLGLARALFTNPSLLVLDEATSALDSETEQAVSQAIDELGSSVTRITIAHRLATVMHADKVIYLDAGRIVASGTFDEVRSSVPEFDQQAKLLGL